jgi:hypothetical protein
VLPAPRLTSPAPRLGPVDFYGKPSAAGPPRQEILRDETELLPLLLAQSSVRRMRAIEVAVHPIGGDNCNVTFDAALPLIRAHHYWVRANGGKELLGSGAAFDELPHHLHRHQQAQP